MFEKNNSNSHKYNCSICEHSCAFFVLRCAHRRIIVSCINQTYRHMLLITSRMKICGWPPARAISSHTITCAQTTVRIRDFKTERWWRLCAEPAKYVSNNTQTRPMWILVQVYIVAIFGRTQRECLFGRRRWTRQHCRRVDGVARKHGVGVARWVHCKLKTLCT